MGSKDWRWLGVGEQAIITPGEPEVMSRVPREPITIA